MIHMGPVVWSLFRVFHDATGRVRFESFVGDFESWEMAFRYSQEVSLTDRFVVREQTDNIVRRADGLRDRSQS